MSKIGLKKIFNEIDDIGELGMLPGKEGKGLQTELKEVTATIFTELPVLDIFQQVLKRYQVNCLSFDLWKERKFASKLPHQVCHDKLISRKIELAASVHAIWVASSFPGVEYLRLLLVGISERSSLWRKHMDFSGIKRQV
ncbi:hypothetical protein AVEN_115090-1 [Araneus ventricosus]|uniref:Uncharacterized protein n=1 Tax=Araneus ventricosus TaxID=182803 RepID=A0A4Y1ZX87_ARAVE|nr:hypothetical protein AVEN_115090-1 [Araneus ventricosus]